MLKIFKKAPKNLPFDDLDNDEEIVQKLPDIPKSESVDTLGEQAEFQEFMKWKANKTAYERMTNELNEFARLFPDIDEDDIPDSVWESVKNGIPLAAAYALYEKRQNDIDAAASLYNDLNARHSSGRISNDNNAPTQFNADEVCNMSRDDVRKNYSRILDSMKSKWFFAQ